MLATTTMTPVCATAGRASVPATAPPAMARARLATGRVVRIVGKGLHVVTASHAHGTRACIGGGALSVASGVGRGVKLDDMRQRGTAQLVGEGGGATAVATAARALAAGGAPVVQFGQPVRGGVAGASHLGIRHAANLSQVRRLRVMRPSRRAAGSPLIPSAAAAAAAPSPGSIPAHGLQALEPAENLPTNYFQSMDEDDGADDDLMPPASSTLADILPYLYRISVAQKGTAVRLAIAVSFMVLQKGTGIAVPIYFKFAVDRLTEAAIAGAATDMVAASLKAAAMALLMTGVFKAISGVAAELRSVAFTPVAQAAGRRVALQLFNHVLSLDLSFHLDRRTGALQRIIDRGTRSITMVFRAVVFTFLPTAMELVLVCGLLWHAFR